MFNMKFMKEANAALKSAKEMHKDFAAINASLPTHTPGQSQPGYVPVYTVTQTTFVGAPKPAISSASSPMPASPMLAFNLNVPPHVRQSLDVRRPEYEARLAELKELVWAATLESAARNMHIHMQSATTPPPDYLIDSLTRLQEHIKKFDKLM